jgi:hypothetical protein
MSGGNKGESKKLFKGSDNFPGSMGGPPMLPGYLHPPGFVSYLLVIAAAGNMPA